MEPEVAFGIVLRELRKKKGLSQEALAHDADMERNYISLLELGKNSASLKMIFRIAFSLDITVAELIRLVESTITDAQKTSRRDK